MYLIYLLYIKKVFVFRFIKNMPRVNVKGLDEEQLRLEFVANPPDIPVHTSIIAHAIEQFALAVNCLFLF